MALDVILFDLDDTLYPRERGLMQEIGRRIQVWLREHMGLSWEEAIALRRDYSRRYGTTMAGLIAEHDVDIHDYLIFVHDIPVGEYLDARPALGAMLDAIPLRKVIYTNGTAEHGWRVLRALEVAERFEQVIGIEEVGLRNKVHREAYEQALALLGVEGRSCIMVDDTVHNLRPAKALGLTTVLVDADGSTERSRHRQAEFSDDGVDFVVRDVLQVGQVVDALLSGES
jgi:putative hydrolase of the HAD superfamily